MDSSFDASAAKREVSFTINSDLYAKAQAAGIDASRVAEAAIATALAKADREQLLADIRQDMEVLERYVAEHGNPVEEWREMFGTF